MINSILQLTAVRFLGNDLRSWLIAAVVFVAVGGALFVVRRVLVRRLEAIATRTATGIDDFAVDLLRRTRWFFILLVALFSATNALTLPDRAQQLIRLLVQIALLLQVGAWGRGFIAFWLDRWADRRGENVATSTTVAAFGALARFGMWTILVLFALQNVFGLDITALVTGLGIGGVAIALAVQNVLGDLFAALSIVLDKPFVVGDPIGVDSLSGTVEHIGLKTTRVRSVDGEQIIFSNGDLLKSRLRNFRRMTERRVVFPLSFTYDTPPALAARVPTIMREIIERTPRCRFDRCHFARFEDAALVYEIVYWVLSPDYLDYMDTRHAINLAILGRFGEEGARFAFPTRIVRVEGGGEVTAAAAAGA